MEKVEQIMKKLKVTKVEKISFISQMNLKNVGKKDGLANLPQEDVEGYWTTPFIEKEIREMNDKQYSLLILMEQFVKKEYENIDVLAQEILQRKARINTLKRLIPDDLTEGELKRRKRGEEELDDTQVISRRKREHQKRIAEVENKIKIIEEEVLKKQYELDVVKAFLTEINYLVEVVCDKMKNLSLQRINLYWRSLIRYSDKKEIPVTFLRAELSEPIEKSKELRFQIMDKIRKIDEMNLAHTN